MWTLVIIWATTTGPEISVTPGLTRQACLTAATITFSEGSSLTRCVGPEGEIQSGGVKS